jgi:hypothetical protein
MGKLWRDYNLSIVLLALFLTSWIAQGIFQWFEIANEAQAHGQEGTMAEFIPAFFSATFENWQSEFLQLFTMVVLTAFLIHRGSHESKDQDEKVDQTLGRIERRLEQLEQGLRPGVREEPHGSLRPTPMLSGSGATPVSSAL